MSDVIKLKEAIAEYRKAHKGLDEKLKAIEDKRRLARKEQAEQRTYPA